MTRIAVVAGDGIGTEVTAEAIKVLARGHQNLIWARTRHANALRSALREYYRWMRPKT